jgi:hypothetical protein
MGDELEPEPCKKLRDALRDSGKSLAERVDFDELAGHFRVCGACRRWSVGMLVIKAACSSGLGAGLQELAGMVDMTVLSRCLEKGDNRWQIKLDALANLYLPAAKHGMAMQPQVEILPAAGGDLELTVADRGPQESGSDHRIDLRLRTGNAQWIERWACCRIHDAKGALVAIGLLQLGEVGSSWSATLRQTEASPYSVEVEILKRTERQLMALISEIQGGGDLNGSGGFGGELP